MPGIAIVMGSSSDWEKVDPAIKLCRRFQLQFTVTVASAHRSPELVEKLIQEWEEKDVQIIIAVAGKAAHLPGVIASKTLIPVIGVPISASALSGQDALYSIVMMPPGVPVASVGIDDVKNAVILAAQIIALQSPEIKKELEAFRNDWHNKIKDDNDFISSYLEKDDS